MHLRFTGCLKKTLMCFIIQLKYIIQTLSILDNIKTSQDFCKQAHLTCQQWKSHALSPLVSKNSSGFDSLSSSAHTKRKRQLHSLEYRAVCRVPLFWLHQKNVSRKPVVVADCLVATRGIQCKFLWNLPWVLSQCLALNLLKILHVVMLESLLLNSIVKWTDL